MKRFFYSILTLTALLLTPACSSMVESPETPVSSTPSPMNHDGHDMENTNHETHSSVNTKVKLTPPAKLVPNQPLNLAINVQDSTGKPVTKFDTFQEKIMHLIVVSDDLRNFDHIHPEYKENGRFEVSATFPESGSYTIFSDYKPAGQKETVSLTNITIPGTVSMPKNLEKFTKTKTLSDTKVNLNISEKTIKAGADITLTFDIKDNKNQPVTDLQTYLGEKAHLVIIKSSLPLTVADYIHAHAMKNAANGKIEFHTKFPKSGTYKMWMQFNRNGKIKTADFWVNVE
ncbi:MAG: hypothetical protein ACKO3K_20620 [Cuspidothrix sp.]